MLDHKVLKDLQSRHPLFSRTSGQVVWLACEEYGLREAERSRVLDNFMEMRENALEVMHKLESTPDSFLLIKLQKTEGRNPCPACRGFDGRLVPACHPKFLEYLPPYSITCLCRSHFMCKAEAEAYAATKGLSVEELFPATPPKSDIYCEEGWGMESESDD